MKKIHLAGTILCALLSAAHAAPNLVQDGTFNEGASAGTYTTYFAPSDIGTAWTVTNGSVDLIGSYWQQAPGGSYTLDLDGDSPGTVTQTIALNPGDYTLDFYLSGNPDDGATPKVVDVSVAGANQLYAFTPAGTSRGNMGYELESLSFSVTSPTVTQLTFASQDVDSAWGPVVGDISLTSTVPEPGSLPLILAGVGLLVVAARRRAALSQQ